MSSTIRLRFAMEIWSITFQIIPIGALKNSPYLLAKEITQGCRTLYEGLASVHVIACSRTGDLGYYHAYVKFDYPPEPSIAIKVLSRICVEMNALQYTVSDPLNFGQLVKLPWEQSESGLDLALARIREGQQKIIADVATGMDLHVEEL